MAEQFTKATVYLDDQQAEAALKSLANQMDKYLNKMNEARKANDKAGFDKSKKEYNAAKRSEERRVGKERRSRWSPHQ